MGKRIWQAHTELFRGEDAADTLQWYREWTNTPLRLSGTLVGVISEERETGWRHAYDTEEAKRNKRQYRRPYYLWRMP